MNLPDETGTTPTFAPRDDQAAGDWRERALCAQVDVGDDFFPDRGGSTKNAKATCALCPVKAECLEFAIATDVREGVWGGLSERQLRTVRRARRAAATDSPDAARPSPVAAASGDSTTTAA